MSMGAAINSQQRKEMGKMRKSYLKKVATKSFVGRVLRRLLGEEKGTVMMEYIVVGLLIAAVAVVAVGYFGGGISDMFTALTHVVVAQPTAASGTVANAKAQVNTTAVPNTAAHTNRIQSDGGTAGNDSVGGGTGW